MKQCKKLGNSLSSYMDGVLSGAEMRRVADHLRGCSDCTQEYESLRSTTAFVNSSGRRTAPPDLALRLRVAIARERARVASPWWQSLLMRFENSFNRFMIPATTGVLSATIVFFALGGFMALPEAGANDVPTMLYQPPRLLTASSVPESELPVSFDSPVVVYAYVGPDGRVEDYRIISGQHETPQLRTEVENALLFTQFEPAKSLGQPSAGRVVIAISSEKQVYTEINVRVRG